MRKPAPDHIARASLSDPVPSLPFFLRGRFWMMGGYAGALFTFGAIMAAGLAGVQ